MGLEPTISAWKANVLPLHYTRILGLRLGKRGSFSRIESRSRLTPPPSRSATKKPAAKSQHCCDFLTRLRSPPDQLHFANTPVKGYLQNGAGNGARTRHLRLGKAALYQMSYSRIFSLSSFRVVRAKRFELIRPGAPEPKSGASANSATPAIAIWRAGDPSEIRTPDTLIKSQVLYRLS